MSSREYGAGRRLRRTLELGGRTDPEIDRDSVLGLLSRGCRSRHAAAGAARSRPRHRCRAWTGETMREEPQGALSKVRPYSVSPRRYRVNGAFCFYMKVSITHLIRTG